MKRLFVLAFILCALASSVCAQQSLTNNDVIEMVKAGLSSEIITAKIKNSSSAFDTSPDALKELKAENVPDAVILAMVQSGTEVNTGTVVVPEGTSFTAVVLDDLSSQTASEGDAVTLKVAEDVIVDGHVVIKSGAVVKGRVTDAEASGRRGKGGRLRIGLQTVNAVDGQKIRVTGTRGKTGQDKSAKSVSLAAQGNIFAGMIKGDSVKIKSGTKIEVYTDEDKSIVIQPR